MRLVKKLIAFCSAATMLTTMCPPVYAEPGTEVTTEKETETVTESEASTEVETGEILPAEEQDFDAVINSGFITIENHNMTDENIGEEYVIYEDADFSKEIKDVSFVLSYDGKSYEEKEALKEDDKKSHDIKYVELPLGTYCITKKDDTTEAWQFDVDASCTEDNPLVVDVTPVIEDDNEDASGDSEDDTEDSENTEATEDISSGNLPETTEDISSGDLPATPGDAAEDIASFEFKKINSPLSTITEFISDVMAYSGASVYKKSPLDTKYDVNGQHLYGWYALKGSSNVADGTIVYCGNAGRSGPSETQDISVDSISVDNRVEIRRALYYGYPDSKIGSGISDKYYKQSGMQGYFDPVNDKATFYVTTAKAVSAANNGGIGEQENFSPVIDYYDNCIANTSANISKYPNPLTDSEAAFTLKEAGSTSKATSSKNGSNKLSVKATYSSKKNSNLICSDWIEFSSTGGNTITLTSTSNCYIQVGSDNQSWVLPGSTVTISNGQRFRLGLNKTKTDKHTFTGDSIIVGNMQGYTAYKIKSKQPSDKSDYYQDFFFGVANPQKIQLEVSKGLGELSLQKSSATPGVTDGLNSGDKCYYLGGAVYNVYGPFASKNAAQKGNLSSSNNIASFKTVVVTENGVKKCLGGASLTTVGVNAGLTLSGASGTSKYIKNMKAGYYAVVETTAPKGFALDKTRYVADLNSTLNVNLAVTDVPLNDPIGISITKSDKNGTTNSGASLEGAEFTIKYYQGDYTFDNLPSNPTKTWVIKTKYDKINNQYRARLDSGYFVKGDKFYLDSDGKPCVPLGTLTIEETKAPEGYRLSGKTIKGTNNTPGADCEVRDGVLLTHTRENGTGSGRVVAINDFSGSDDIIRGDFKFTKKAAVDGSIIPDCEFELSLMDGDKTVETHKIVTDENGYFSTENSYVKHSDNTNGGVKKCGTWFGGDTVDDTVGALPYGHYKLSELRCEANKNKYTNITYEFDITENGVVVEPEASDVADGVITIGTTAKCEETGDNTARPGKETVTITDTCHMEGLEIGHNYKLSGKLMDKATGEALVLKSGSNVTAETEFTAENTSEDVDVVFTFSAEGLEGKDVVVFETLTDLDYNEQMAEHKDIGDEGQTIHFADIHTTAMGEAGNKKIPNVGTVTIVDKVYYKGLSLNKEYKVIGTLMDKATGKPVTAKGVAITSEKTFTVTKYDDPKTKSGIIEVKFTFDISELDDAPKEIVVFEKVYKDGKEFLVHEDINDKDQTVELVPSSVMIMKVDKLTGSPLAGAEFTLYKDDGTDTEVAKAVSGEDGIANFEKVEPGKYYVKETKFPTDYAHDYDEKDLVKRFEIKQGEASMLEPIIIKNYYSAVCIMKIDADDKETVLPGAEFTLYDENMKEVAKVTSGSDGIAKFTDIDAGKYFLKETKAPAGYKLSDAVIEVDTKANEYTMASPIMFSDEKGKTPGPPTGDETPLGMIMAVGIGLLVVLILSVLAVFFIWKRKNKLATKR